MFILLCANRVIYRCVDAGACDNGNAQPLVEIGPAESSRCTTFAPLPLSKTTSPITPRCLSQKAWIGLTPQCATRWGDTPAVWQRNFLLQEWKKPLDALANAWCRLLSLVGLLW
jgi:hypothetical protein